MGLGDMPRRLEEKIATVLSAKDYDTFCDNCGLPGDIDFHDVQGIQVQLCSDCHQKIVDLLES
ncbi:MAG: hypothetical protein SV186_04510 [Candidatus Nanohaloarchaea archaeon]|nr:hypothetical protein [Candidatus Nanohaloarchaea archaeon]